VSRGRLFGGRILPSLCSATEKTAASASVRGFESCCGELTVSTCGGWRQIGALAPNDHASARRANASIASRPEPERISEKAFHERRQISCPLLIRSPSKI
jgi:hypothetical protein